MPGDSRSLRAVVVGGGPVGCLVAIELRKRSFEVDVYERGPDIRSYPPARGHSFNLTLTKRGMDSLDEDLLELLYGRGVPLPQRIVHAADGTLSYQPYGSGPEHHLLSIPRGSLHELLLQRAENAGARFHFHHEFVGADPSIPRATFAVRGVSVTEAYAELLVGCDGANSMVRHVLSRSGARMQVSQDHFGDGFVEVRLPADEDGGHTLLRAHRDPAEPRSEQHGLHIWSRGHFMLMTQPNTDGTYTAGLWMPLTHPDPEQPSWETITSPEAVNELFAEHFADVVEFLPSLASDVLAVSPAPLKTIRCLPYHHQRTVLLGDSAHTLVPFFGQGINCSFEDVRSLMSLYDASVGRHGPVGAIDVTLPEFTRTRKPAGDAIADLSLAMSSELKRSAASPGFQARTALEKLIHRRHPDLYVPLYHAVAFTHTPYHEVTARHARQSALLDELCARLDPVRDAELIIDAYAAAVTRRDHAAEVSVVPAGQGLSLSPDQEKELLDRVAERLAAYQGDLAKGGLPASFGDLDRVGAGPLGPQGASAPYEGTELSDLLDQVFDQALPSGMLHAHAGFLSHVPSGGLFQGAVGEFVARSLNRFAGAWAAAPGFVQIETAVVRWFCTAMGYGEGSFGYLTTGGSIANFMALRCALEPIAEDERHRSAVYVSAEGHFSVQKAARLAGLRADRVRSVPVDAECRMDLAALRAMVERDLRDGVTPACVVATAGTTNTGAVDDIEGIAALCGEWGVWLHVDACFGGFFRLTARGRELLAGTGQADSVAVDAHKSLFLPHGNSALLVRRKETLKAAFAIPGAAYIPELSDDEDRPDFMNYGPEVTREVRGLTAWLPLRLHGLRAFEEALDRTLDLADDVAARLAALDGVTVVPRGRPHLPTVTFRLGPAGGGTAADGLNERTCELINSRGNVYLSTSSLPGHGTVLRVCVMHHRTDAAVLDRLMTDLEWARETLERDHVERSIAS
ncbi:aminotransferase class V-fold PLP-dependent enzyme [Streptomyces otsuchiensis]|uniref:aminotransferase class V-fold PLP-dependent enzyme n=1 Tax=Streptomyces otsuchiensis TaxID=2681388 RepID=UPI0010306FC2|nr:aminotransferase class V-fold PLP-dependent enzyme [Streptomyces otsuchiensis]